MTYRVLVLWLVASGPAAGQPSDCGRQSVGEHALAYCVHGSSGPVVVLATGTGQTSSSFDHLVGALRSTHRVVTFDRAGLGRSEAGPLPRTPTVIADELRRLLDAIDIQDPMVLVGHSAGGWHVLRLAEMIPDRVRGVVLLDTPPPDFENRRLLLLTPAGRAERQEALAQARNRSDPVTNSERASAPADLARGFGRFPSSIPLIAVVANGQEFGAGDRDAAHRALWVELSAEWPELSERSEMIVADGSGHLVHRDAPQIVLRVVRRLTSREHH